MDDQKIIEALTFRNKSMGQTFENVRPSFQTVSDWVDPARGRSLGLGDNADRRKQINLIDSTPRKAFRTLKAGLMGGLSSPSRPWFKLKLRGFESPKHEMKVWLDECQRIMYDVLASSNAYNALSNCYGDLGLFGVYAGIVRSSYEDVIHIQSFPVGSYLMAQNDNGIVDTLHWTVKMTVREIMQRWPDKASDRVKGMYERNQMNDTIEVQAAIEPRLDRDPLKPAFATNMPIAVYYWESKSRDKLLHAGGLEYNGILGPRWETVVSDPWPVSSPARDALGDIRQLQTQQKDKDIAIQMGYKPPLMGPADAAGFSYYPGAYNPVQVSNLKDGGPRPVFQSQMDLQYMLMGIQETQGRVSEAFFADLFRLTSEYGIQGGKDVTATFVAEAKEEKLIVLGPVLESLDRGLLAPLIEATFHYCQEAEILPPAPDDAVGSAVQVEFTSLLAQAQRAIGVAAMERTIGFAGTLAQIDPEVIDNLDGDALLREFGDQVGFPAVGLRDPKDVAATREGRAQQAQMQQMMEQAQPMAAAANLISEANERGQSALAAEGLV